MFLWIQNTKLNTLKYKISSISTRTQKNYQLTSIINKGTSFFTWRKASLTIEAAVVIPLLAGFLATILFLFQVIRVQVEMEEAIMYAGRMVAVESSQISDSNLLLLSAEGLLLLVLEEEEILSSIEGGFLGISLLGSEFEGEEIRLKLTYHMGLPVSFWDIGVIPLSCENRFRKWTGDIEKIHAGDWVYITEYGEAYHLRADCQTLKLSIKVSSWKDVKNLRGKDGQKYYPCWSCGQKTGKVNEVYYTDYGVLYHESISCSSLKRSIYRVPLSEIGKRHKCSYCGY